MSTSPTCSSTSSVLSATRLEDLATVDEVGRDALLRIGVRGVAQLVSYLPVLDAIVLVRAARGGEVEASEVQTRLLAAYQERPRAEWPGLPVAALSRLPAEDRAELGATFGIQTVGQLARLPAYHEAVALVACAVEPFAEAPSAPADLVPAPSRAASSSARFSTFVRERDLRGLFVRYRGRDPLGEVFDAGGGVVTYLGFVLGHQQRWFAKGVTLGEVVHSVALAPGESRNLAFLDWTRGYVVQRAEQVTERERLTHAEVHRRALDEVTRAVAEEHQFGGSSTAANTAASAGAFTAAGAVAGAIIGAPLGAGAGAVLGNVANVAGGLPIALGAGAGMALGAAAGVGAVGLVTSNANTLGRLESDSSGQRSVAGEVTQRIVQATNQKSSAVRSLRSTVVVEGTQGGQQEWRTSTVTNYNHMHALTVQLYELLQRYDVEVGLETARPLLYLPFSPLHFDEAAVERYWPLLRGAFEQDEVVDALDEAYHEPRGPAAQAALPPEPQSLTPKEALRAWVEVRVRVHRSMASTSGELDIRLQLERDALSMQFQGMRFIQGELELIYRAGPSVALAQVRAKGSISIRFTGDARSRELRAATVQALDAPEPLDGRHRLLLEPTTLDSGDGVEVDWPIVELIDSVYATNEAAWAEHSAQVAEVETEATAARRRSWEVDRERQEILRIVQQRRYAFTRRVLELTEPEQIAAILDDVLLAGLPLHRLAHTVPVGFSGNHVLLEMRSLDGPAIEACRAEVERAQGRGAELEPLVSAATAATAIPSDEEVASVQGRIATLESLVAALKQNLREVDGSWTEAGERAALELELAAFEAQLKSAKAELTRMQAPALARTEMKTFERYFEAHRWLLDPPAAPDLLQVLLEYAAGVFAWVQAEQKAPPVRDEVSLPSAGLFAEAVLGRSNAAEKLDMTRFAAWHELPIPNPAPTIAAVDPNQRWDESVEVATTTPRSTLSVANAPSWPDPVGLAEAMATLRTSDLFRDMSHADQLVTVTGQLAELAGTMGRAAAQLTGDSAAQAMRAATRIGAVAAGLAGRVAASQRATGGQSTAGAGSRAPTTLTEKGATLEQLDRLAKEAERRAASAGAGGDVAEVAAKREQASLGAMGLDGEGVEGITVTEEESRRWDDGGTAARGICTAYATALYNFEMATLSDARAALDLFVSKMQHPAPTDTVLAEAGIFLLDKAVALLVARVPIAGQVKEALSFAAEVGGLIGKALDPPDAPGVDAFVQRFYGTAGDLERHVRGALQTLPQRLMDRVHALEAVDARTGGTGASDFLWALGAQTASLVGMLDGTGEGTLPALETQRGMTLALFADYVDAHFDRTIDLSAAPFAMVSGVIEVQVALDAVGAATVTAARPVCPNAGDVAAGMTAFLRGPLALTALPCRKWVVLSRPGEASVGGLFEADGSPGDIGLAEPIAARLGPLYGGGLPAITALSS